MASTGEQVTTDQHIALVRQVFSHLENQDHEAAAALCHDDFELRWKGLGTRENTHRGRDALERHLAELSQGWDELHVVCDNLTRSSDRVLAMYHLLGQAPGGETAQSPHAALISVRDDRLARWDAFQDAAHSFDWLAVEARLA